MGAWADQYFDRYLGWVLAISDIDIWVRGNRYLASCLGAVVDTKHPDIVDEIHAVMYPYMWLSRVEYRDSNASQRSLF